MVPIYREPFEDGELVLGWPTWDPTGRDPGRMSVKYSYMDKTGKRPSRGAPEVSMEALVGMVELAVAKGALTKQERDKLRKIL